MALMRILPIHIKKILVGYLSILQEHDISAAEWLLDLKFPRNSWTYASFLENRNSNWWFWLEQSFFELRQFDFVHDVWSQVNRVNGIFQNLHSFPAVENPLVKQTFQNGALVKSEWLTGIKQYHHHHRHHHPSARSQVVASLSKPSPLLLTPKELNIFERFAFRYLKQKQVKYVFWKWQNVIELYGKRFFRDDAITFFDNCDISPDFIAVSKAMFALDPQVKQLIIVVLPCKKEEKKVQSLPLFLKQKEQKEDETNCERWAERIRQFLQWNQLTTIGFEIVFVKDLQWARNIVSKIPLVSPHDCMMVIDDEQKNHGIVPSQIITIKPSLYDRYFRCRIK